MADETKIEKASKETIPSPAFRGPQVPASPPPVDDRASIVAWLRRPIAGEIHEVRNARLRYADEIEEMWDQTKAVG